MPSPAVKREVLAYRTSDDYAIHYRRWSPAGGSPRGYVVALHGIQSHSGWYQSSSRRLAEARFEVRFFDRRGSGMNEQNRGHAPHADRLVNDVVHALNDVHADQSAAGTRVPVVLLGVSWGGKLATAVAARRPELVDALALLYPGIRAKVRPNLLQKRLLRLGMATGKHRKRVRIPLDDPALFTADEGWQERIRQDPLAIHQACVSFLNASVDLDRELAKPPQTIQCPGLLMLAGGDQIIDNRQTLRFFGDLPLSRARIETYRNAAHTLEFEPDRDEIFSDLVNWMNRVCEDGNERETSLDIIHADEPRRAVQR